MDNKNKRKSHATQILVNSEFSGWSECLHWKNPPSRKESDLDLLILQIKVFPLLPNFDSSCLFCAALTAENEKTWEHSQVLCTPWNFPCVSLAVTQWHCGGCVCCGNHNMEKVALNLYFVVVLFCCHVGLLLPLVHSPSWIPKETTKSLLSHLFLPFFYSLAQSIFSCVSGNNLVLPSAVPVDQEIKIPPQSWGEASVKTV